MPKSSTKTAQPSRRFGRLAEGDGDDFELPHISTHSDGSTAAMEPTVDANSRFIPRRRPLCSLPLANPEFSNCTCSDRRHGSTEGYCTHTPAAPLS